MYAGASGDFNIIHWNERVATSVGLPNVIAHGMFTMAEAGRVITDWVGDPGAVVEYGVRFSSPVPVPTTTRAPTLEVARLGREEARDRRVSVALEAKALGRHRADQGPRHRPARLNISRTGLTPMPDMSVQSELDL